MEELSIEDKAKRYDEAIKVAKGNYETIVQMDNDCTFAKEGIVNTFHHIFPELKESEDERIKKMLRDVISQWRTGNQAWCSDVKLIDATLAWLEKQGEQKPVIKLELDDNGEPVLTPFEAELFSMMSEAWQDYSFGKEVNIAKIVKAHSIELLERANEQNPAWSEEDERERKHCVDFLNHPDMIEATPTVANSCKDWLKSLKDRVQPYPKQEWSEEERQIIEDAACFILSCVNTAETEKEEKRLEELADKLQDLRPQFTWKPSEQDILLLERISNGKSDPRDFQASLQSIIEQLKKLKG